MQRKYGQEYCEKLNALRYKTIKADVIFYLRMIELYDNGDEDEIVNYLESLVFHK
jgi:hypothetical protein